MKTSPPQPRQPTNPDAIRVWNQSQTEYRDLPIYYDQTGTLRFVANSLHHCLTDCGLDLNRLAIAYGQEKFSQWDYLEFYASLGYSVDGLLDLSFFEDLVFEQAQRSA